MSTTPTIESSGTEKPHIHRMTELSASNSTGRVCRDCGHVERNEQADDETALAITALKIVHGKTAMLPTKSLLKALHNSHVRTFQQINEILDEKDSNPFSRLARIRKLTEKAGKPA